VTSAYGALKALHITCVALSIGGFVLRMWWKLQAPTLLQHRSVKIVPHVVDTVLLVSGVALAWQLGADCVRSWLPAKMVALIAYIVLGTIALRRGPTRTTQIGAAAAAVLVFLYIIAVAIHKDANVLAWLHPPG